jgi:pSer/pThr/pTyr-binding forkhead associated (FHA) protein
MLVRMPLPAKGLMVGRGESNDIVLRSRSVSRSHLRLVPLDDAVLAQDCGATNPATLEGKPLEGTAKVHAGQFIMICGASIGVEEGLPDPAA